MEKRGKKIYNKAPEPQREKSRDSYLTQSIMAISVLSLAVFGPLYLASKARASAAERPLPANAQIIDQRVFNVLEVVPPPAEFNATTVSPTRYNEDWTTNHLTEICLARGLS